MSADPPWHPDWLIPQWSAPAGVHALCTTRAGGVSVAPYASLNLGDHVGDRAADVAANRSLFAQALGAKPVFLNQVHGTQVLLLDAQTPHACEADASLTLQAGVACTIMVADCLPVLFATRCGTLVGAAHAGWRSLVGLAGSGILEQLHKHFMALAPVQQAQEAPEIVAWLGPCIGSMAFEVGDEVRTAFLAGNPRSVSCFTAQSQGKWLADLAGLARQRLLALGITQIDGNDGSAAWCTVSQPSRFFSHRRDGISGRMAVSVWRTAG